MKENPDLTILRNNCLWIKMSDRKTKTAALIVASTGSFIMPFIGSAINVALPDIEKTFTIDAVLLSWVATAYLLAAGISLVPAGRIADIHGRKRIMQAGFALSALASLGCAIAPSIVLLIAARILQGIASGMIFSTSMAILVSVFPPQERGKAIGITVSAVYIGLSTGPFIGGILTLHLTWRSLFWLIVLMTASMVMIIRWGLKGEWREAPGEKLDIAGSLIYTATLIALIYGLSILPSPTSIGLLIAALAGGVCFIVWENRVTSPVFEISLFRRNRTFAFSNLAALIHYSATFGVTFMLSLYLQYIKGLSPQGAGTVLIAQPITMALVSPLAGRLSDRIEPRFIASAGMGITGAMLFLLSFLSMESGLVYIVACLLILGIGFAFFSSPNMNAIMSSVEKRFLGIASGSAGTMRLLGQMLSMGVATLAISMFVGRAHITPAVHQNLIDSTRAAFILFAVLCFVGVAVSMVRGDVRKSKSGARTELEIDKQGQ